jgi:hypothetical protein
MGPGFETTDNSRKKNGTRSCVKIERVPKELGWSPQLTHHRAEEASLSSPATDAREEFDEFWSCRLSLFLGRN